MISARLVLLRAVVGLLLLTSTVSGMGSLVAAPAWPNRPVRMVVPYGPGGSTDLVARLIAPGLSAALGQPVLIENMAGVGGIAGVSRVAKAAPDGYLFVVGNVGTHVQNQYLFAYPPYDAEAEFVPAALLADLVMLVAVRANLPIDGLNDFIAHLHANAAKMQYAGWFRLAFSPCLRAIELHTRCRRAPRTLPRRRPSYARTAGRKGRLFLLQRRGHQTAHRGWPPEGTGHVFPRAAGESDRCSDGAGARSEGFR